MNKYEKGSFIGKGTYGTVVCATDKTNGQSVALKKVKLRNSKEGVNMSVLRELRALKALKSPHIVDLLDVFTTKSSLVLVFEFMDWSLEDVIRDRSCQITAADIKSYMRMLLQALSFIHSHQTVHRDVKPDNMLIASNGVLKLADFGLARSLTSSPDSGSSSPDSDGKLTPQVFGRWYRPPELLLGCTKYGCAVDMWAAGCVMAELMLREPWFSSSSDFQQLNLIYEVLGVPSPEAWPGMVDLPNAMVFSPAPGKPLEQIFKQASEDCLDLLQQLMQFDPDKRISAAAALQHPYFSNEPQGTPAHSLPRPSASRANRRNAASIPAFLHDMLMHPDMLVRQQQQHAMKGLNSSRSLFPGGVSFSTRYLDGFAAGPQGMLQDSLLRGPDAAFNGASGLSKDCLAYGCQQEQTGLGQLGRRCSTVSGCQSEDGVASDALRCTLSFGSANDDVSGMQEHPERPNSVEVGQEVSCAAAGCDEQQPGVRRPSPIPCSNQQQQNSCRSSMRPPLHRTGSAQAPATCNTTPVILRPCSAGAVVQGHSASTAAGHKRKVSDLSNALSSAATATGCMAGVPDVLDGLLAGVHPQHDVQAPDDDMQGQAMVTATPAGMQRGSSNNIPALKVQESDLVCPMSIGASTQKRPRVVFESTGAAAAQGEEVAGHTADRNQQEQQTAATMSIGRRYLRGRRSSIGCCNMETDATEQPQQQHSVVGSMLPPATHTTNPDHSTTKQSMQGKAAHSRDTNAQHALAIAHADSKQQQLEALGYGHSTDSGLLHSNGTAQGALQLLQPWQHLPAGAAGVGRPGHNAGHPTVDCCMVPGPAAAYPPQAADLGQPLEGMQRQSAGAGDSKSGIPAPSTGCNTADSTAGGDSVGPCTSYRLGCLIGGLHEALPAVQTVTDNTPGIGNIDEELARMDHHQLVEWASQWKPVVQSAEKRYLVERKLQMDEALLQASQPDVDDAAAGVFSPALHPKKTVMFRDSGDDRRCNSELLTKMDDKVFGQPDNLYAQTGPPAAYGAAATAPGSNNLEAVRCYCMTD